MTYRDSNSITMPLSCSPTNICPLDYSQYLIKIHFFSLGPNFSHLWEGLWKKAVHLQGFRTFKSDYPLLHDMLYALAIHWNLMSVFMLIKLSFSIVFHSDGVDLYLEQIKYYTRYFLDGFIVLDVIQTSNNIYFSLFTSSFDHLSIDVNIWHARLDHIGQ